MKFSDHFDLGVGQSCLDFVNIPMDTDIPLFIDPFAIGLRNDIWSNEANQLIVDFFQNVVDTIMSNDDQKAKGLLLSLREPNETHLGFSKGPPRGSGLGPTTSLSLFNALKDSSAVKTGFISSLEDAELMIEGIGKDRISDLTTNIIKSKLLEYTIEQCLLWDIPTREVCAGSIYNQERQLWMQVYHQLPVYNNRPLLLVPKFIARYNFSYDNTKYYNGFVLDYLHSEHISFNSSLVFTLKNGRKKVRKKDLKELYPKTKEYLYQFSKEHPEVLKKYRNELKNYIESEEFLELTDENISNVANILIDALQLVESGRKMANVYERLMLAICEFIFFPNLTRPEKQPDIHEGRKRLDIIMDNSSKSGIFYEISAHGRLPCPRIVIELKNYSEDISNPELDQLSGRFSRERGMLGLSISRNIDNIEYIHKKCHDTLADGRGLILPLDDNDIKEMLNNISNNNRNLNDLKLRKLRDLIYGFNK
ncbi:MAG: hypothetical protein HQ568_08860 [Calditrichaeota bacterium]|nr:hypothetical protein [Calditrichota bacterium]